MRLHDLFEKEDPEEIEAQRETIMARIRYYAMKGAGSNTSASNLKYTGEKGFNWMSSETLSLKFEDEREGFPEDLPLNRVTRISLTGPMKTFKNLPKKIDSLHINVNDVIDDPETDSELDTVDFYGCKELSTFRKLKTLAVSMYANNCPKITTFEAFPEHSQLLYVYHTGITSFKDIHKHLPNVTSIEYIGDVKSGYLDLLKLPKFRKLNVADDQYKEQLAVAEIINKYAGKGVKGVVQAQRELIEADLEDYE